MLDMEKKTIVHLLFEYAGMQKIKNKMKAV
jgi:hypothetical protein